VTTRHNASAVFTAFSHSAYFFRISGPFPPARRRVCRAAGVSIRSAIHSVRNSTNPHDYLGAGGAGLISTSNFPVPSLLRAGSSLILPAEELPNTRSY